MLTDLPAELVALIIDFLHHYDPSSLSSLRLVSRHLLSFCYVPFFRRIQITEPTTNPHSNSNAGLPPPRYLEFLAALQKNPPWRSCVQELKIDGPGCLHVYYYYRMLTVQSLSQICTLLPQLEYLTLINVALRADPGFTLVRRILGSILSKIMPAPVVRNNEGVPLIQETDMQHLSMYSTRFDGDHFLFAHLHRLDFECQTGEDFRFLRHILLEASTRCTIKDLRLRLFRFGILDGVYDILPSLLIDLSRCIDMESLEITTWLRSYWRRREPRDILIPYTVNVVGTISSHHSRIRRLTLIYHSSGLQSCFCRQDFDWNLLDTAVSNLQPSTIFQFDYWIYKMNLKEDDGIWVKQNLLKTAAAGVHCKIADRSIVPLRH
ncbi:hypothetical protein ABKN59_006732 [Abortiporus biennis]